MDRIIKELVYNTIRSLIEESMRNEFVECAKNFKFGNLWLSISAKFVDNKFVISTKYEDLNIPIDILDEIKNLHMEFTGVEQTIKKDSNCTSIVSESENIKLISIFIKGEPDLDLLYRYD